MTPIYLLTLTRPLRPILLVDAEVVTRKLTWVYYKDHRYLLGASAFYTLASAARARAGALVKVVSDTYIERMHWHLHAGATKLLVKYRKDGAAAFDVRDLTK